MNKQFLHIRKLAGLITKSEKSMIIEKINTIYKF